MWLRGVDKPGCHLLHGYLYAAPVHDPPGQAVRATGQVFQLQPLQGHADGAPEDVCLSTGQFMTLVCLMLRVFFRIFLFYRLIARDDKECFKSFYLCIVL